MARVTKNDYAQTMTMVHCHVTSTVAIHSTVPGRSISFSLVFFKANRSWLQRMNIGCEVQVAAFQSFCVTWSKDLNISETVSPN